MVSTLCTCTGKCLNSMHSLGARARAGTRAGLSALSSRCTELSGASSVLVSASKVCSL